MAAGHEEGDRRRRRRAAARAQLQGSRVDGMDRKAYIARTMSPPRIWLRAGAGLDGNELQLPQRRSQSLLCHDPHLVEITEAVKNEIGDRPLIVKLAYIPNDTDRPWSGETSDMAPCKASPPSTRFPRAWWTRTATRRCQESDVTVPACGNAIRGAGLDMVRQARRHREKLGFDFAIMGVGGVIRPGGEHREAGANAVMSATGAMWDANLAREWRHCAEFRFRGHAMPYVAKTIVFELDPRESKRLSVSDNKNDILHVEGGKPLNGTIKVRGARTS